MGWTWHYLHEGIAWTLVQRMMIDAPSYEYESERKKDNEIILTEDNADEVMNYINSML